MKWRRRAASSSSQSTELTATPRYSPGTTLRAGRGRLGHTGCHCRARSKVSARKPRRRVSRASTSSQAMLARLTSGPKARISQACWSLRGASNSRFSRPAAAHRRRDDVLANRSVAAVDADRAALSAFGDHPPGARVEIADDLVRPLLRGEHIVRVLAADLRQHDEPPRGPAAAGRASRSATSARPRGRPRRRRIRPPRPSPGSRWSLTLAPGDLQQGATQARPYPGRPEQRQLAGQGDVEIGGAPAELPDIDVRGGLGNNRFDRRQGLPLSSTWVRPSALGLAAALWQAEEGRCRHVADTICIVHFPTGPRAVGTAGDRRRADGQ